MSQYCLGCYYHYGIGTEINFEEAVNRYNRYKKASDNGMVRANIYRLHIKHDNVLF